MILHIRKSTSCEICPKKVITDEDNSNVTSNDNWPEKKTYINKTHKPARSPNTHVIHDVRYSSSENLVSPVFYEKPGEEGLGVSVTLPDKVQLEVPCPLVPQGPDDGIETRRVVTAL